MYRKNILFIEDLRLLKVIILFFVGIFKKIIVRYDEYAISRTVNKILLFINKRKLRTEFQPLDLSLEKKEPYGITLTYEVDETLRSYCDKFCHKYISSESSGFQSMVKCYLSSILRNRVAFIKCSQREIARINDPNVHHVVLLKHHFCNNALDFKTSKSGFSMKETFINKNDLKEIIRPIYFIYSFIRAKLTNQKLKTNISQIKPSIWIQYDDSFDTFVDTAFWKEGLKEREYDIVYYLDRRDTPCVEQVVSKIEKKGFKWIDFHEPLSMISKNNLEWSAIIKRIQNAFSKKGPLWLKLFWLQYYEKLFVYTHVYNFFKTKIIVQNLDTSWVQEVQARAVESAGGILMGFHWSNYPCVMTPLHLFPQHVFFTWGKIIYDNIASGEHSCRHIIPSGMWIEFSEESTKRLKKFTQKHRFVISIFDSSAKYNMHQTPYSLSKFFLTILNMLEKNPPWGAILKSKNQNMEDLLYLPEGEDIVSRLKILTDNEKVLMLDVMISPVAVAKYSNLSVCYGLNSAGIVVGSHGFRAIHWDCSGWRRHPFYKNPDQNIIFQTLEELEGAILQASHGDQSIGDFSYWQKGYNHFPDDNARQKVGCFVKDYMHEINKKNEAGLALDLAVKTYLKNNNIEDTFFKANKYWD